MKDDIKTAVIGSFPATIDTEKLAENYFNQNKTDWNKIIGSAVNDMVNAGIKIISDGQTRDPFIQLFTRKLKGCRIRNRTEIVGKIEYDGPITIEDQQHVKNIIPKDREIVGVITGPYTLTCSCVDLYYNDERKVAFDFAEALQKEADKLQDYVDIVSIDEPFFSNQYPEYAKELIQIVLKNVKCKKRLHCCGDVTKIIPNLLDMPVDILSHEFKASPKLFDAFKKYDIDKSICLGSVRSDKTNIESVDEIVSHIERAKSIFDSKIVQISPDCGLKMLPRTVAIKKLENLSKAGEIINGR